MHADDWRTTGHDTNGVGLMTSDRRARRLAAVIAGLLLAGSLAVVTSSDAQAQGLEVRVSESVEGDVASNGEADVIVALRTSIPTSPPRGATDESDRRRALGRAAQSFVDQLPDEIDRPSAPARSSRFVNLRVDSRGLEALRDDDAVAAVLANEQRSLSLAKSTPMVGAPIAWADGHTGAGTAVAIIDTGVQTSHPFLAGRVVGEACFSGGSTHASVSSFCPGGADWDDGPGTGGPCTLSECVHGTHVAGIAAGTNGPGTAPSGVAPGANIVSVMVASRITSSAICGPVVECLTLFDYDVLSALDWVGFHQETYDVVAANMSFGGGQFSGTCDVFVDDTDPLYWYTAYFQAYRADGIAPVVASGNDGFTHQMSAPACISSAISVGAVATNNTQVPFWSNSSSALDLLAPGTDTAAGVGIRSSVSSPASQYAQIPGTSMAAPHVAGAFAVLHDAYPGISVDLGEFALKTSGRPVLDTRQNRTTPLVQLDEAIPRPKGTYHPVDPARLLDTREGIGAPKAKIGANRSIDLQVTGRGGVPASGVSAVVLNVTYVQPTSVGYLAVWPTGALRPNSSNLNLVQGDARPNLVTVRMGANGKVSIYNAIGAVDVVADVAGWYDKDPANTGGYFHSVAPVRVLDTREGVGAPKARVGPGAKLTIDMDDVAGTPVPDGATAVVVNLTGVGASSNTYVTAYPADLGSPPVASNLNLGAGHTRPNLAIVPLDATGKMTLYNNAGTVDLIADVQGWYDDNPAGFRFVPKTPTRLLDTRFAVGAFGPLGANGTVDVQVGGTLGIPENVEAVVMNVTSTGVTAGGYVTVFPDGIAPPFASNLNLEVNRDVPNLVTTAVPTNGKVSFYNKVGSVHLIGDVAGWFEV